MEILKNHINRNLCPITKSFLIIYLKKKNNLLFPEIIFEPVEPAGDDIFSKLRWKHAQKKKENRFFDSATHFRRLGLEMS